MLKNLFQSREDKIREKVESYILEGKTHLASKFYNGAMIAFDKAMELDPEAVYPRLVDELSTAAASGETEAALAVGLNLLKQKGDDFHLANKLGNFARELKDYKQANGLYKTALKINKKHRIAYFNLAASLAKVDIYDEAVPSALSQFEGVQDYQLPDYVGDEKFIEKLMTVVLEAKQAYFQEKQQELLLEKEVKKSANDMLSVAEIDMEIKSLKKLADDANPDDIINEIKKLIVNNPDNTEDYLYNLALYALSEKKPKIATEALNKVAVDAFETVDLLKAIALEQRGQLNKAVEMLIRLLGKNEYNRYNNVNLGLMLRKSGKQFLSLKYLIKTAHLLNKSNGFYSMKELVKTANEDYEQGRNKKALNYYKIAVTEISDPELWNKIGTILLENKKYDDAAAAFRDALKIDPEFTTAKKRLKEVHDYYYVKADELIGDRKFGPAADYYKKAFQTMNLPETAKKAAEIYKQLNNISMEKEMTAIWKRLVAEEKARDEENMRQELIEKSNQFIKNQEVTKAVGSLEAAFVMKVDRDIFMQLAKIYKQLNKKEELDSLVKRWEVMLQIDDKLSKHQKEVDRKRKTINAGTV